MPTAPLSGACEHQLIAFHGRAVLEGSSPCCEEVGGEKHGGLMNGFTRLGHSSNTLSQAHFIDTVTHHLHGIPGNASRGGKCGGCSSSSGFPAIVAAAVVVSSASGPTHPPVYHPGSGSRPWVRSATGAPLPGAAGRATLLPPAPCGDRCLSGVRQRCCGGLEGLRGGGGGDGRRRGQGKGRRPRRWLEWRRCWRKGGNTRERRGRWGRRGRWSQGSAVSASLQGRRSGEPIGDTRRKYGRETDRREHLVMRQPP